MSDQRVSLIIGIKEEGGNVLQKVQVDLSKLDSTSKSYTDTIRNQSSVTDTFTGSLARLAAALGGVYALKSMVQTGLEYNETIFQSTIGIATLIGSFYDLKDAQGNLLTGQAATDAAMEKSKEIIGQLQVANLETAATFDQLVEAFQGAIAPGAMAGMTLDQVAKFTVGMTQAMTALGKPLYQLRMELQQMLQGNINMKVAPTAMAILQIAGVTQEAWQQALKMGNAYELIAPAMEKLGKGASLAAAGMSVAWSNLADAFKQFMGTATSDVYKMFGKAFTDLKNQIIDTTGKVPVLTEKFKDLAKKIGDTLVEIFKLVKVGVGWIMEHIEAITAWGKALAELFIILKSYSILTSIANAVVAFTSSIAAASAGTAVAAGSLTALLGPIALVAAAYLGLVKALQWYVEWKDKAYVEEAAKTQAGLLADRVEHIRGLLFRLRDETRGVHAEITNEVGAMIVKAIPVKDMEEFGRWLNVVAEAQLRTQGTAKLTAASVKSLIDEFKKGPASIDAVAKTTGDAGDKTKLLQKALEGALKEMKPFGVQVYDLDGNLKDLSATFSDGADNVEAFNAPAVDFMNNVGDISDEMLAWATRTSGVIPLITKLEKEVTAAGWAFIDWLAEVPSMAENAYGAVRSMLDLFHETGRDMFVGLMDGQTDFMDNLKEFTDGMKEIWAETIENMMERWVKFQQEKDKNFVGPRKEFKMSAQEWGAVGMAAFSTLGNYATANNPKGQQVMAVGSAIASLLAMINPIIGAVVMALTAVAASLQDNGKRSLKVIQDAYGNLIVSTDRADDIVKDMQKRLTDTYRKYFTGFRDILFEMGVDTGDMWNTLITYFNQLQNPGMNPDAAAGTGMPGAGIGGIKGSVADRLNYIDAGASVTADAASGGTASVFWKDAVGDAMKRFDEWLERGLGTEIFNALDGMFRQGFTNLGVTQAMQDAMMRYWSEALNADDMFESIMRYLKNVMGLQEEFTKLQQSGGDLFAGVKEDLGMSFADQLAEFDADIISFADTVRNAFDFEDMNERGATLLEQLQKRYEMELQYLQQLAQMQDKLNKSAEEQLRSLSRIGLSNEDIIGLDMQEYQSLMEQLMGATTAEEAAAIFQQIQSIISEITSAAGDNAGAYKDVLIEMLTSAKDAMNEKMNAFADAVAQQNQALYDQIGDVLGYFTGTAYDSADALDVMSNAALMAANALYGVAGEPSDVTGPYTMMGGFGEGPMGETYAQGGYSGAAVMPPIVINIPPMNVTNHFTLDTCDLVQVAVQTTLEEIRRDGTVVDNSKA